MPHPKKKTTKSARNQRRSHHALKEVILTKCSKCGKPVKSHHVCASCGYYKNKEVIDVLKKLSKKERSKVKKENAKKEAKEVKKEKKTEKEMKKKSEKEDVTK